MHRKGKTNWKPIIVYYLLACAIAWPFFWWRDVHPESWAKWQIPWIVKNWTIMWGPGLSVFIVTILIYRNRLKTPDGVSLFGHSVVQSLLFWFVPFLMLAIPGLPNNWGINPHLFPVAVMGILGFISIIGEDLGWSCFLKNRLITIPPLKRSVIIGVLWETWHFTNRTAHRKPLQAVLGVALMMFLLIILTYIMGKMTDRTKSLVTAVAIHMWINVLTENGCLQVYIAFGLSIVFWIWMYKNWNQPFWNRMDWANALPDEEDVERNWNK